MIPSVNFNQPNRSHIHFQTEKILPHTPTHKTHDPTKTAIKKIHNFSYGLSDEIGLGLTSKVFKGKNDLTGLPVAIKCIQLKKQMDQLSQQFLSEEIATLEKIKTVQAYHLLKLESVILTSNNLYIVTEFCEGKDVGKILRQKKTLSEQQAQTIMRQMIYGYRQLYSMGFIHRDLKTSNLLVTNGKIKIADFGFAISQQKCKQKIFTYNAGSPKYMPPESLKFNNYSVKSDIWAMGIIAYELVYGHSPWKSLDEAKLYDLTTTVPIESLLDPNISVSNQYKTFIVNCLRPNFNQRAGPQFIFNFSWPLSQDTVQGYFEQKKIPEVIKLPGKNYAIYSSANQIKYDTKQLDVDDFVNNPSIPSQFTILSQLNYCRFLIDVLKGLRAVNGFQDNQLLVLLSKQITTTLQILLKGLGEVACTQKNRYDAPNFESYIKTGDWQNLKQLIIRYDIQFREQLQSSQPLQKNATIPQTSILPESISYLKTTLPQNIRIIDKLITCLQLRQIFVTSSPFQFATKVDIAAVVKQALMPDQVVNMELIYNRVLKRLSMINL